MEASKPTELLGYARSCKQEDEKPIKGEKTGEIPKWLKGCLIRVGSGLLEIGPDKFNHLFDGLSLMHRFSFENGDVTYQNRFLRSDSYRANKKANRIITTQFGTRGVPDPCKTIFQRFASVFSTSSTDNDLVTIVRYGKRIFACSETNFIWEIHPETLESIQKVDFKKYLPVNTAIAHAHEDNDGTVYNIGANYGYHSGYSILKFPPNETKETSTFDMASVVCKIPASRTMNISYYHSFAMTENYFIMVEQPLFLSLPGVLWMQYISGTFCETMKWDQNSPSRFHVVRRSDGKLLDTSYISSAFFLFHHINAYEQDDHLVIDLCGYDNGEVIQRLYIKALEEYFKNPKQFQNFFDSSARRYVLPLNVDKNQKKEGTNLVTLKGCEATATLDANGNIFCTYERLTGAEHWSPELPRIHYEKYNGKKYKYFYAMAQNDGDPEKVQLIKVNTETKETVSWRDDGAIPSEPIFVADPNSLNKDEDSGVVVASLLYQDDESKVSMLVLDAKTMKEMGRVTFKTSSAIPGDFHGLFLPKN